MKTSGLFFCISDLANIDPMYQYSLDFFKGLFTTAIMNSEKSDDLQERLGFLNKEFLESLYRNICRSLFEKDKLIFSALLTFKLMEMAHEVEDPEFRFFLTGGVSLGEQLPVCPCDWMAEKQWGELNRLSLLKNFNGFLDHFINEHDYYKKMYDSANPQDFELPDKWKHLDKLQFMCIQRCIRPDLLVPAISNFVVDKIGHYFVTPPAFDLGIIFKDSAPTIPLVFVLSPGADPLNNLEKYAESKKKAVMKVSLGQGQGPKAEAFIKDACQIGNWVMLQNCHLARSWMPSLEKIVLEFAEKQESIHEDFRLFLTSMPADYFPVSVLQNSVKLTTEPPRGLRANLKRTYQNMSQNFIEDCSKPEIWRKLLFCIGFFHAVIQERRKFGPLGWNIRYEFNDSDLETSFTMLKLFLDSQDEIPWDALLFVTGHINYGGRVTDDLDRRCLLTILEKYCQVDCLKEGYKFSLSGNYYAPSDGPVEKYRNYIEDLPMNDNPEIFGLHDNANINYQEQESNRVIETILSIQPRLATAAGGLTPDEIVLEKAKEFLDRLPEPLDKANGFKDQFITNEKGLIPSLSTVLLQEMEKFNRLLGVMKRSLIDIEQAIKGFIVMSATLDSMYLKL
mmetsp:Transcript_11720/g.17902  ORF Transcript_11720/g.17902 Transcript_11720/m.17902 type:complete len:621 (+) Transcript_11720:841-2703(+)